MDERQEGTTKPARARQRLGLSVDQLAKKAEVRPDDLLRWEAGDRMPGAERRRVRHALWEIEALGQAPLGAEVAEWGGRRTRRRWGALGQDTEGSHRSGK